MTEYEKKISFLNRYFVYKKIRNVNTEKIQMEFGDYNPSEIDNDVKESLNAVEIAKQTEKQIKPKIRKINKKLIIDATPE